MVLITAGAPSIGTPAIQGLARSLARDLAPLNIRVNTPVPGQR